MKKNITSEAQREKSPPREQWRTINPFARKNFGQFMQDVTMHGVANIANEERAVWSRALWTVKTLCSLGIFLYLFIEVMSDYYSYPHTTTVEATPADEMEFPAITICNINTLDVTNLSYGETLREIKLSSAFTKSVSLEANSSAQESVYSMSAQRILEDTDPGIGDFFVTCFYDNDPATCEDIFNIKYWGMTRCHTLDVSKLAKATSSDTSLRVVINVNQPGYVLQADKSSGVEFFVHDKNLVPNLQARASTAAPGFSTHVGLMQEKLTMLEKPFTSFGGRYCQYTDAIDMSTLPELDPPYRLMNCLKAKVAQLAQDNCTCSLPFSSNQLSEFLGCAGGSGQLPLRPDLQLQKDYLSVCLFIDSPYPNCTLRDMLGCVQGVLDIVKGNPYSAAEKLGCPLPCEITTYDASISFSSFPSLISETMFLETGLIKTDNVTANIVSLDFYYTELILRETTYEAEYSSNSIMGLLGGNMGFFLGASMLSVFELIELGVVMLCTLSYRFCCRNKARKDRKADHDDSQLSPWGTSASDNIQ